MALFGKRERISPDERTQAGQRLGDAHADMRAFVWAESSHWVEKVVDAWLAHSEVEELFDRHERWRETKGVFRATQVRLIAQRTYAPLSQRLYNERSGPTIRRHYGQDQQLLALARLAAQSAADAGQSLIGWPPQIVANYLAQNSL